MNFTLWEQHSDLGFRNIEFKIERTIEDLRSKELALAYEYWVSDKKWNYVEGKHELYLKTDKKDEAVRIETA